MNRDYVVSSSGYRQVIINELQTSKFCSNSIHTTKYTILTFLPLFLYEQFHNYTNCFFLLVSIIQQFPEASSLGRFTTLIPLSVILTITAIKEVLEDFRRHRADMKINSQKVEVLKNMRWVVTEWKDIQVGDLIKVNNDDFFPADLLFLKSSNAHRLCYIETVNLDGENNLKIRIQVPGLNIESLANFTATVELDHPNEYIYKLNGILKTANSVSIPITACQLLLRGAILRNTNWIVGAVMYTGSDTKIMKNSRTTRLKRSSVSVMVNSHVIALFVLFLSYTVLHWIFFMDWNNDNYKNVWYLPISKQDWTDSSTVIIGFVFGVIYSIVIPISLTVMQELSRFVQAIFISSDLDMYYEKLDIPALVKTSSLNEDLALVKYIFADKTGTLTKNILEFKCCSIQGNMYTMKNLKELTKSAGDFKNMINYFFIAVSVCPGVVPVRNGQHISYFVSSPDQKALILAAREFGVTLVSRTHDVIELNIRGSIHMYEVKCDFEFTSDRRRTSVIVKTPSNELILFVIGADDVILKRCIGDPSMLEITRNHIEDFSSHGLRSLCVAMAKIEENDFETWYSSFKHANETLDSKENLIDKVEASIVKHLSLIGCAAIEDQLQDEVPETIESLQKAGINIWILTGDKQETAINIGHACRLLSDEISLIILNSDNITRLRHLVSQYKQILGNQFGQPGNNYGLVVLGESLMILFQSAGDVEDFVLLMLSCRAVICCRTTPKQKALVVKNVQKRTNFVTLAIGDGANDVAMIQTASIGVGISGMEGLQAANAADYSIGQFKYLKKLLLVHGTWCYNRICKMIYFMYYKNVAVTTIQFYYTGYSAWSGQLFFDRWAKMLYNVMLTSAPTLALGVFEQNVPAETLINNPYMYMQNRWFDFQVFCCCLLNAFIHSILLSWLTLSVFNSTTYWSSGLSSHYMIIGNVVYTCLVTTVCLKSGLHTSNWTSVTFLFLVVSEISWIMVLFILSHTWPILPIGEDMSYTFEILLTTPLFWLFLIFSIVVMLGFDLMIMVLYRMLKKPVMSKMKYFSIGRIGSNVS